MFDDYSNIDNIVDINYFLLLIDVDYSELVDKNELYLIVEFFCNIRGVICDNEFNTIVYNILIIKNFFVTILFIL